MVRWVLFTWSPCSRCERISFPRALLRSASLNSSSSELPSFYFNFVLLPFLCHTSGSVLSVHFSLRSRARFGPVLMRKTQRRRGKNTFHHRRRYFFLELSSGTSSVAYGKPAPGNVILLLHPVAVTFCAAKALSGTKAIQYWKRQYWK